MTGRPLRLGVLGCADIAVRRVLPAVAASPSLALVAVGSRDPDRGRAVTGRFGGEAVEGYDAVLERSDVDAVYVPLPAALHHEWVCRAIRAGKHVLAEKPLTTTLAETEEAVALARDAGLVLRENFMFVHHSQHRHVRALIADGAVGRVRAVTARFAVPPRPPGDIRLQRHLGGGALNDVGVYPLRAAQLLLGPELTVRTAELDVDERLGVDLGGRVLVQGPDDMSAHLTFGMAHDYTSRYEVDGDLGRIRLDHAFTPAATHRPTVHVERQGTVREVVLPADDQCSNTLAAFARAVRRGPLVDDSIVTQAGLVEAGRQAAHDRAQALR
ncbi:putative dehydrogenase [Krasilnikovia cinnamomea]|uniref:Putative dehydrogenase n=1 Tax=Krasilnikovia cinnamomea TaxID=349313 RepID=A0A4Q7ZMW0_9ACTN|nr:putative dehydrogenase [Krasilnikovia cinnamomea]